jgi:hypothetical protein
VRNCQTVSWWRYAAEPRDSRGSRAALLCPGARHALGTARSSLCAGRRAPKSRSACPWLPMQMPVARSFGGACAFAETQRSRESRSAPIPSRGRGRPRRPASAPVVGHPWPVSPASMLGERRPLAATSLRHKHPAPTSGPPRLPAPTRWPVRASFAVAPSPARRLDVTPREMTTPCQLISPNNSRNTLHAQGCAVLRMSEHVRRCPQPDRLTDRPVCDWGRRSVY